MEIFYHGLTHASEFTGAFEDIFVCLSRDRDLALAYAGDDPSRLPEVTIAISRPLVLDTPEAFRDAWIASGANGTPTPFWGAGGAFRTFLTWAAAAGHDAVDVMPSAFDGDLGHEWTASLVGEPQTVTLVRHAIIRICQVHGQAPPLP